MDKQRALREVDDMTQAAEALERARRDLADEYIALKTNFMALAAEYRTEVRTQFISRAMFSSASSLLVNAHSY